MAMITAILIMLCACTSMELVLKGKEHPALNGFEQGEFSQDNLQWLQDDVIVPHRNRGRVPSFRTRNPNAGEKWPGGVIPYIFHKTDINDRLKEVVMESIAEFENYTCVRWKPKTEDDKFFVQFSFATSFPQSLCGQAYVGMWRNVVNDIRIKCVDSKSVVMHEMMHTMGFEHEFRRPDRQIAMDVMYHNMPLAKEEFDLMGSEQPGLDLPYDPISIMQYPITAIPNLGHGRFALLAKDPCIAVGWEYRKKNELTRLDIMKINKYYQCDDIYNISGTPPEVYYDLNRIWTNGTFQYQCFMEGDKAVPKAIACFDQQNLVKHEIGETFEIGGYKCRCDIKNDVKEAKITILSGCDNFTYTEWIMGRYAYNYECDRSSNQLVQKIVGCTTPIEWAEAPHKITGVVRHGQVMKMIRHADYYCKIYENGTKARIEWKWKD